MFDEYSNLACGYYKDILAQSERYLNETSSLVSSIYKETAANCERIYNECSLTIMEFYDEPAYNFKKLVIDYLDMTEALHNEIVINLKKVFNVYSEVLLTFFNETKIKLRNQYDIALQHISLTYCIDCVMESPLFYNLTAALVLIHVHRRGLNVITLLYLFLKFFIKSKLLVSAYQQFVEPLHSALIANSKLIFNDNQRPNDQMIYFYLLILHLIASIILTVLARQKIRLQFMKLLILSTAIIYVKSISFDGQYSSVNNFNLDDTKYTLNRCLNINQLESDILLVFMIIFCFCDKSEKIGASKADSKQGHFNRLIGSQCARIVIYFITLTTIIPAHIFIAVKSVNAQLVFWPYEQSIVCEINAANK